VRPLAAAAARSVVGSFAEKKSAARASVHVLKKARLTPQA
jgi:hypothetical protein